MRLILLRHAETEWNAQNRIQGRADIPLSASGRDDARTWILPLALSPGRWVTSPMTRAIQTADAMGVTATIEPSLIEMDWGTWEGETLPSLRQRLGQAFGDNEDRGLDFTPPDGESPRMVQARVMPWLQSLASEPADVGVIAHKGVIRAIVALAANWDMLGKPPARVSSGSAQIIGISEAGTMTLEATDVRLSETSDPDAIE